MHNADPVAQASRAIPTNRNPPARHQPPNPRALMQSEKRRYTGGRLRQLRIADVSGLAASSEPRT
jgi:hypothetical protein